MNRLIASSMVIARRDFTATVFSRTFLLFLLGPFMMIGFGGLFGYLGGQSDDAALRPVVAVIGSAGQVAPIRAAYDRLEKRVGARALPELRTETPAGDPAAQARSLLTQQKRSVSVVLADWPDHPRLIGPQRQIDSNANDIRLILEEVANAQAFKAARIARPEPVMAETIVDPAGGNTSSARHLIARGGQTLLFMLTVILSGMLLSNLVEEKSNKVIEVLAAAVPIDAIFFGKLTAMLGVSLTGILVWGSLIGGAIFSILPVGVPIPVPAVGWPLFVALGAGYYVMNYLLLGGVQIGIGAQASSVREVQTLSMPLTMAQLGVFLLASATVSDTSSGLSIFAAIFPLSSPLAMLARAAQDGAIWPHFLALAWQALWVVIIIRFAARRFRVGVLKSGGPKKSFWRRKAAA